MVYSLVKVAFVGGPSCGHTDEIEPQEGGKPPAEITPSRANGGKYRRRDDASQLKGVRMYDWQPGKPAKKPAG